MKTSIVYSWILATVTVKKLFKVITMWPGQCRDIGLSLPIADDLINETKPISWQWKAVGAFQNPSTQEALL